MGDCEEDGVEGLTTVDVVASLVDKPILGFGEEGLWRIGEELEVMQESLV